jgi:hypothetical protein
MRYLIARRSHNQIEQNWLDAIGGSGVFYFNNFDFSTRQQLIDSAHTIRYGWVGAPTGPTTEDPPPAPEKVGLATDVKLSGRGSLLLRYRNGLENLTQSGPSYAGSFDGIGATTENTSKQIFYVRWCQRHNAKWLATPHPTGTGTKHMILFQPDSGFGAGQIGHLTHADDPRFPLGWEVQASFERFQNTWVTNPPGVGDDTFQPFVDLGPQSSGGLNDTNSLAWFQRRYGPVRREVGNYDAIADFANYPLKYTADDWYVAEMKVDKTNDEIKLWFARYGTPPILTTGRLNAGISVGAVYTGFQSLLRVTDGTNQPFSGDDCKQYVTEIVCSDNPIPFPGGFPLPYSSAGAAPPGYPYLGSSENT